MEKIYKSVSMRFYPTATQEKRIIAVLDSCNTLYNAYLSYALVFKKGKHTTPDEFAGIVNRFIENGTKPNGFDLPEFVDDELFDIAKSRTLKDAENAIRRHEKLNISKKPNFKNMTYNRVDSMFISTRGGFYFTPDGNIRLRSLGVCKLSHAYGDNLPKKNTLVTGRIIRRGGRYFINLVYTAYPIRLRGKSAGCAIAFDYNRYCTIYFSTGEHVKLDSFTSFPNYKNTIDKMEKLIDAIREKSHINYEKALEDYRRKRNGVRKHIKSSIRKQLYAEAVNSKSINKIRIKVERCAFKLNKIMEDFIKQIVNSITGVAPEFIIIYDFNISNIVTTFMEPDETRLAILKNNYSFFRKTIRDKCKERGIELRVVNSQFDFLHLCSNCKATSTDVMFEDDEFKCTVCGTSIDKGLNSAINIFNSHNYVVER